MTTYWRIQDAGLALSTTHRSRTWSEDSADEGEEHAGTSAVRTVADLARANPSLGFGDVEIVKFSGREVGTGWDGEPIVIPEQELLRFRLTPSRPGITGLGLTRVKTIRDLLNAGWREVARMAVK